METTTKPKTVWNGGKFLRRFLIAIADLEPFDGNPRQGDVASVRLSLRRFGQTRAVLVDGSGTRIVAGHHVVLGAIAEGWTHVAVIPHEFRDEEEARAYLLADNRTHDLGSYDYDRLLAQLKLVQERGLEGTGYDAAYVEYLDAEIAAAHATPTAPPEFPTLDPGTLPTEHRCPSCGYEWSGNPAPNSSNGDGDVGDGD